MTFDSEGNDNKNSIYFSRKAHVPSDKSGITIGRGYDLKKRKSADVYKDLVRAGVNKELARKLSKGAKLKGNAAKTYLKVIPGVPKKTIHCLISCNVKSIKAVSLK